MVLTPDIIEQQLFTVILRLVKTKSLNVTKHFSKSLVEYRPSL